MFLFKQNFAKSKKSEQMHFLFYNCKVTGKLNSIFNATGEWREVVKKAFMDKIHYAWKFLIKEPYEICFNMDSI